MLKYCISVYFLSYFGACREIIVEQAKFGEGMASFAISLGTIQTRMRTVRLDRLAMPVNILLVVWLAWQLAALSWEMFPDTLQMQDIPMSVDTVSTPSQRQGISVSDEKKLAGWHLFGVAGSNTNKEAQAAIARKQADMPDTRLNLKLRGVLASDDPNGAYAIVAEPGGVEKSYGIGDTLPGGARVSEVFEDRIILDRGGRFETLRLPEKKSNLNAGRVRHRSSARRSPAGLQNTAASFQKYRDEVKKNPGSLLKYVKATPARKNGKFIGFRVSPGKQRGALAELGLKSGDIVTSMNGVKIDSPENGMKAMQSLGKGSSINVSVLRDGETLSMNLTLP